MSFAFACYAFAWLALLCVSWHPLGAAAWMILTVAPFVLAGES